MRTADREADPTYAGRRMTTIRTAPQAPAPIWSEQQLPGHTGRAVAATFGIAFALIACVAVLLYLVTGLGVVGVVVSGIAALVPFLIVLLVVRWIDRWEPEPRPALVFAVLWGAGVAVAVALIFDLGVQIAANAAGTEPSSFLQAVVQAPLVEEGAKGFGVLLLLWFNRRNFDGPVDGIVYATAVAAGFAFTENIQYFGRTLVESGLGPQFIVIFVARGIFSPFAHALFTSCTGYALGKAAERTGAFGAIGFYLLGLIPAALLHALWNGGLALASNSIEYYFVVEVPLFLLAVGLVVAVRARERAITRTRLTEYADAGWFTREEVDLLSTWTGRRHAMRWADVQPDRRRKRVAMTRFVRDATRLGHARQRLVRGRTAVGRTPDEQELLGRIVADRAVLTTTG
jgi:RsiW-degrading membrane proteinase PrsW (M82 family)